MRHYLLMIASFKFKFLIVLRTTTNHRHRGVLIYTKKCLKAVAVNFSVLGYWEYVYYKLSKNSGLLHILGICRSPNSTIEDKNNLNSIVSEFSKLNVHLLILDDFNYPTIIWATLGTPHNKQNRTIKLLTITQKCFLHNQIPTLIDLIFTSSDQGINNVSILSPLGKSYDNVITFHYQLECVKLSKVDCNYHKANYTAMKRKFNNTDW